MDRVVVVVTSLLGVVVRIESGNKSRMPRLSSGLGIGLMPDSIMTFLISIMFFVAGLWV